MAGDRREDPVLIINYRKRKEMESEVTARETCLENRQRQSLQNLQRPRQRMVIAAHHHRCDQILEDMLPHPGSGQACQDLLSSRSVRHRIREPAVARLPPTLTTTSTGVREACRHWDRSGKGRRPIPTTNLTDCYQSRSQGSACWARPRVPETGVENQALEGRI